MGTFNLHASLLPQYRGAAPITWAVINGETETGITTFFLQHEIDTGRIIQQVRVPIAETDCVGDVHDRLMMLGGRLVTETVDNILAGTIQPIDQSQLFHSEDELKPAPKIFRDTCRIDWTQPVRRVYNFVRGLSPYPAAWTELQQPDAQPLSLKIYKASIVPAPAVGNGATLSQPSGSIRTDGRSYLHIACADGWLDIAELQLAGKRRMPVADNVVRHAVSLVAATRPGSAQNTQNPKLDTGKYISYGAGPRASQYLIMGARTHAALQGKYSPDSDDVRAVACNVLRHRIVRNYFAEAEGISTDQIITELLKL
jgi:methionyl-tRNA formyltransferase